jgi:hypothetical protein
MGHYLSRRASWLFVLIVSLGHAGAAAGQDRMCDPGGEDCRAIRIGLIRSETVAIDVSFWFMEDAVVLSHSTFLTASPGALKNDTTILVK